MNDTFEPPREYLSLLESLGDFDGTHWLGDVGFFGAAGVDPASAQWRDRLVDRRWDFMHPDLLPFAEDGAGNRFCFYVAGREEYRSVHAIVYWMYETYTGVPITSTFDGFLEWIQLSASSRASRGTDPLVDEAHFATVVQPAIERAGHASGEVAHAELSDATFHHALLDSDIFAPASWLMLGMEHLAAREIKQSTVAFDSALRVFPEFHSACLAQAQLMERSGDIAGAFDARLDALRAPMVFSGDPEMVRYGGVPALDVEQLCESLMSSPSTAEATLDDPMWHLLFYEDPTSPQTWLQLSDDYERVESMASALVAAENALFLGVEDTSGVEALRRLEAMYATTGQRWHANVVARDLKRIRAR